MPGKPFTQRPECGESRVSVCEKIKPGHIKNMKSLFEEKWTQIGQCQTGSGSECSTYRSPGRDKRRCGTKKGNDVIGYSFSPVGCLWLGVLSFSIMWPSGIYRPRFWFAYVGHHIIRAARVCGLLVLINLTVPPFWSSSDTQKIDQAPGISVILSHHQY